MSLIGTDKTAVTNSEIAGGVAGNDINNSSTNHFHFVGGKGSYMKNLLERFKEDQKNSAQLSGFIEDLDYYYNKRKDDVIGLEEKLRIADREDLLEFALDYKDRFQRLLFRFTFSTAAQQIFIHLLAEVQSRFINEIYPLIQQRAPPDVVSSAISLRLLESVKQELDENLLGITVQHINGMLYFLTGNCHIKWN